MLKTITLFTKTTAQIVENVGNNISRQKQNKCFYVLFKALTESTVVTDTVRLFVQGVNTEFEVTEKLACVICVEYLQAGIVSKLREHNSI